MLNRTSNKIRQRKENLKANKPPTFSSAPNKIWFWLFLIVLASAIGYLSYQAYSSNLPNELIIPIAIVVILLLVLIIWYLPKFYVQSLPNEAGKTFDRENAKLKLEDDTRKTFAQIVGGAVLLGGLVFTFNTFRLQQEGQFTDRFTKAVTQIGDDKLEVRLGGLYALERIAKDSPKDHWTVMEILSAYVREKAKKKDEIVKNTESKSNTNEDDKKIIMVSDDAPDVEETIMTVTDIQAALTIIGRRKTEQDSKTEKINLNGADLREASLAGAILKRVDLNETNLSGAFFYGANLIEANVNQANLQGIHLHEANLSGANISGTDLSWAYLIATDMRGAYLFSTNFEGTKLTHADFRGANLDAENLTFEQLSETIIDEKTKLPEYLETRKTELLEISKKNLEKREEYLKEIQNSEK